MRIDIVSDGEFSKGRNWRSMSRAIVRPVHPPAHAGRNERPHDQAGGGNDRKAFPEFYAEYDAATGLGKRLGNRFVASGEIEYVGQKQVGRDIENLKSAAKKANAYGAFLPVVAPASALPGGRTNITRTRKPICSRSRCADKEYRAIVDAGLYVQIDDAFLPYWYEKMVPPMTLGDYRKWAQLRIDALNHALAGIPEEKSRYHLCWGSWNGPHAFDVPMKDIVDMMLQVEMRRLSI